MNGRHDSIFLGYPQNNTGKTRKQYEGKKGHPCTKARVVGFGLPKSYSTLTSARV